MKKQDVNYKLYLVTDRGVLGIKDLYKSVEEAILGGVTIVQLREKDISTLDFYREALRIKEITSKYNVPLIINDRLDIALAVNAEGLHIGQDDMPIEVARELLGPDKIIGVSASTVELALRAEEEGADYLGVGAVYATTTKDDVEVIDHTEVRRIRETVKIPIVAIGGINEYNAGEIMKTGIDGISVISAILGNEDVRRASDRLIEFVRKSSC
ncbi:thiamine phosphate synthase [Clostridium thermarum]|uniref:thiamine phosphate synthase n=1 Tax=Clostridium thermarum TaxID=1716543 RepID=UPI0013D472B7|nr:thiamine phosphate synthase [Clostridium thermarum]